MRRAPGSVVLCRHLQQEGELQRAGATLAGGLRCMVCDICRIWFGCASYGALCMCAARQPILHPASVLNTSQEWTKAALVRLPGGCGSLQQLFEAMAADPAMAQYLDWRCVWVGWGNSFQKPEAKRPREPETASPTQSAEVVWP